MGAVQAFLFSCRMRLPEGLFYSRADSPISIRHIGIYRLLLRITLKNPITKKTALTSKNDKNTMS